MNPKREIEYYATVVMQYVSAFYKPYNSSY